MRSSRGGGRGARAGGRRSRLVFKTHATTKPGDRDAPSHPAHEPRSPVRVGSSCPAQEHAVPPSEGFRRFDVQQWLRAREQRLHHAEEEQRRASSPPPSCGRKTAPSKSAGYRRGRVSESTVRRADCRLCPCALRCNAPPLDRSG